MEEKPKRRWLRFSIRTMLLAVTVLCIWMGRQVQITKQRGALMREIHADGGTADVLADFSKNSFVESCRSRLSDESIKRHLSYPESRHWFGDGHYFHILINPRKRDWAYRQKVAEVFSEADVYPERPSDWRLYE